MAKVEAIYHRTKETNIYPLGGDVFLIEAFLRDEIHDVHLEVEVIHPALEIRAARAEMRNGPFTNVCGLAMPNVEALVGMRVGRGFTLEARQKIGGTAGCHRLSELVVEIAQAAYQLHFVRYFSALPREVREREDHPPTRYGNVLATIPGMQNTCFSYSEANAHRIEGAEPLRLLEQDLPTRDV